LGLANGLLTAVIKENFGDIFSKEDDSRGTDFLSLAPPLHLTLNVPRKLAPLHPLCVLENSRLESRRIGFFMVL
jgi:hypothetical protein